MHPAVSLFCFLFRIQSILKYQSVKGNLTGGSTAVDLEDKFDVLIDANDQILERVVCITSFFTNAKYRITCSNRISNFILF